MRRKFKLHWLTGPDEIISSEDTGDQRETLANAFSEAEYGAGALRALDYWQEVAQDIPDGIVKEC